MKQPARKRQPARNRKKDSEEFTDEDIAGMNQRPEVQVRNMLAEADSLIARLLPEDALTVRLLLDYAKSGWLSDSQHLHSMIQMDRERQSEKAMLMSLIAAGDKLVDFCRYLGTSETPAKSEDCRRWRNARFKACQILFLPLAPLPDAQP